VRKLASVLLILFVATSLVGALLLAGGCGEKKEVLLQDLPPPPDGHATITYKNAQRIVTMARSFQEFNDTVISPFREEIAEQRESLTEKE